MYWPACAYSPFISNRVGDCVHTEGSYMRPIGTVKVTKQHQDSSAPPDEINAPPHYNTGEIECIDAIQSALGPSGFRAYCTGNVLKYIWRHERKGNPEKDLGKAVWYANKIKETYEKEKTNEDE